jgi:DUF1680 family protein
MNYSVDRRGFLRNIAGASLAASLPKAPASVLGVAAETPPEGRAVIEPFDYSGVRLLDGSAYRQYHATRDYYLNIPNDNILLGFRKRAGLPAPGNVLPGWYGNDIFNTFGQWLSGMSRMAKATNDSEIRDKAVYLMTEWSKTINPDGYFYYSRQPVKPHYTYEKTICGLVDLYQYTGNKDALVWLEKITDWAVNNLDRSRKNPTEGDSAANGTEWYTLCENLYRAYRLTGNIKYKTFGDLWRYSNYWGMFTGGAEPAPYGFHAYSHCNTLSSAAMTYAVTGDPQYLKTIVNAYDYFQRTQFYITGGWGPGEKLLRPDGSLGKSLETSIDTFETPCCSWACFKLGKYLLQFTGEARYGDWIEKMLYNGIGATLPMSGNGETFYYSDYTLSGARKVYFREAFPCCSGTYPQAVADFHNIIYFKDPSSLYVNLFVPSAVAWEHDGGIVKLEQETAYPEADTSTMTMSLAKSVAFDLKLRVPEWCAEASVDVNGSRESVACRPGTWAVVSRKWNSGDRVTFHVPMHPKLVPIDAQHPNRAAVIVGPVVLVRENSSRFITGHADVSQWLEASGSPMEFRTKPQPVPGPFVPFYRTAQNSGYGMYFDFES